MLPVVALVGRPNVGKSTLFNVLTGTRDALVADLPGLTRDRKFGYGRRGGRYIVVDTGGLVESPEGVEALMAAQTERAVAEADRVIFVVDARAGVTAAHIAQQFSKIFFHVGALGAAFETLFEQTFKRENGLWKGALWPRIDGILQTLHRFDTRSGNRSAMR